jgi:hypothetical protein
MNERLKAKLEERAQRAERQAMLHIFADALGRAAESIRWADATTSNAVWKLIVETPKPGQHYDVEHRNLSVSDAENACRVLFQNPAFDTFLVHSLNWNFRRAGAIELSASDLGQRGVPLIQADVPGIAAYCIRSRTACVLEPDDDHEGAIAIMLWQLTVEEAHKYFPA